MNANVPQILDTQADYPTVLLNGWQELLEAVADRFDVPSSLIMRRKGDVLEVFLSNVHPENPYRLHATEKLSDGPYCEEAMKSEDFVLIKNALQEPRWKNCRDAVELGMISYLGFPLKAPDGTIFGTICILDKKKKEYDKLLINTLRTVKTIIEIDMKKYLIHQMVLEQHHKELEAKESALQEVMSISSRMSEDIMKNVKLNIDRNIMPLLADIKRTCTGSGELCAQYFSLLERYIQEIDSGFNLGVQLDSGGLTPTETKICNLIRQGKLHKDIAVLLSISENTVKNHAKNIKAKLGIASEKITLKEFLSRY